MNGHRAARALVALIGVQAGRPVLRNTVIVDVGGGSTEVLIAGPALEPVAAGLPLGAAPGHQSARRAASA